MVEAMQVGLIRAILRMVAISAILFSSYMLNQVSVLDTVPAPDAKPDALTIMIEKGKCWNGGEGHPYPDTVVVREDGQYIMHGQKRVDWYISDFSRIDDSVAAFCKLR